MVTSTNRHPPKTNKIHRNPNEETKEEQTPGGRNGPFKWGLEL